MKIAIIGSNNMHFDESCFALIDEALQQIQDANPVLKDELFEIVVQGNSALIIADGFVGASALGEAYATYRNLPLIMMRPDWVKHGQMAHILRNNDMVRDCQVCLWLGYNPRIMSHDILAKFYYAKRPIKIISTGESQC